MGFYDLEKTLAQHSGTLPPEVIGALGFAGCLKRRKNMDSWATTWAVYGYSSAVKLEKNVRNGIAVKLMTEGVGFSVLVDGDDLVLGVDDFADEEFFPVYMPYRGGVIWEEERAEEAKVAFLFGFVCAADVTDSLPYVDFTKLIQSVIKKLDDLGLLEEQCDAMAGAVCCGFINDTVVLTGKNYSALIEAAKIANEF